MSKRVLLALQFWDGDKQDANRLARFIADLEPRPHEWADFLFAARFDCTTDLATVNYAAAKFNVRTFVCPRHAKGWPYGPNELWFGTVTHVAEQLQAGKMPEYEAVVFLESDDVPLVRDWLPKLREEWYRLNPKTVMGPLLKSPGEHINGNLWLSGTKENLAWIRRYGSCPPNEGWDLHLAPRFRARGWAPTTKMRSDWQMKTAPEGYFDELRKAGVVFHHGCKDASLLLQASKAIFPTSSVDTA